VSYATAEGTRHWSVCFPTLAHPPSSCPRSSERGLTFCAHLLRNNNLANLTSKQSIRYELFVPSARLSCCTKPAHARPLCSYLPRIDLDLREVIFNKQQISTKHSSPRQGQRDPERIWSAFSGSVRQGRSDEALSR
jgi:hypothetical protein